MTSMAVAIAGAWALPGCSAFAAAPLLPPSTGGKHTMPHGCSSLGYGRPGGASAEARGDAQVHYILGVAALSASAALLAGHRKPQSRLAAGVSRSRLGVAQQARAQETKYSTAVPFLPVPLNLTNEPLNIVLPGDYGFDPLGFTAENSPLNDVTNYLTEVCENFGLPAFDSIRWYREAELMHGRVAMLASFNIIVRETGDIFGVLPDAGLEQAAFRQFAFIMAALEAYRGTRLHINSEALAGDLGLGMGPGDIMAKQMTMEELAVKQLRELQDGRLAMVGIVGMAAQYHNTGHYIIQAGEVQSFEDTLLGLPRSLGMANFLLTSVGLVLATDGIHRLSNVTGGAAAPATATNEIARQALNPFAITADVQDPCIPLPTGVVPGAPPQRLALTEAQVVQFEEDGVIMIKAAMKHWAEYLSDVTDHQIAHPHVWSLVGRMSGLYDYIQRNMWMTNDGFRNFLSYSPLGHVLSQLSRSEEVRISTDMLLVNPNKGFGWHQDNQNGPIDFPDAIRWWVAMDTCGEKNYGAPEYLKGSHRNSSVSKDAVFVDVKDGDLPQYTGKTDYVPEPGDLIIWDARTIHRIVAPPGQNWARGTKRRAFGGTAAKSGAIYLNKGGASSISDLAGHVLESGEPLGGPYFPRIYPNRDPEEEAARARGEVVGRSAKKIVNLGINLASNAGKYISFTKVLGKKA